MTLRAIRQSSKARAAATAVPAAARRRAAVWRPPITPDRRVLVLSIVLQLALGLLFGHSYDTRIFLATGYLVGTGHDPYVAQNLSAVFPHVGFSVIASVGYPPPWPLLLGLIYRAVYAVAPGFLVYNLAVKIPVIAANVGLAYLVGAILRDRGASAAVSRRAWTLLLLNPLLLYVGAAWGEIDAIVALLALAALALLCARRYDWSAVLLALAVCVKPTALPLLPAALVFLAGRSFPRAVRYGAVCVGGVLLFYVAPFFVLGWSRAPFTRRLNAHFVQQGTMSYMAVVRLFRDPLQTQGRWWLLGLLWIPALAVGVVVALRRGDGSLEDLLEKGVALALIVFLTRTWLAETNVVLIVPLVLILTSLGALDRRALTAVWLLPLVFTLFNASPLQLLWVAFPGAMQTGLDWVGRYSDVTLIARAAVVVAWQVTGWWIVVVCLRGGRARAGGRALEVRAP
jgi:hypothetical protein